MTLVSGAAGFNIEANLGATSGDAGQAWARITKMELELPPGFSFTSLSGVFLDGQPAQTKITPLVNWSAPSPIVYGTPLSTAHLNATANILGTFSYTPAMGTVLPPGQHDLTVIFTPVDTLNYETVSTAVPVNVIAATSPCDGNLALIYSQNFNASAGPEWSTQTRSTSLSGQTLLGRFGNNIAALSLAGLPTHTYAVVEFDVYVVGSWDGNGELGSGPDIWGLNADGQPVMLTTFCNTDYWNKQSYPQSYPGGLNSARQAAAQINSLGYGSDAVYHMRLAIPHSANTLALAFFASGLEDISNESWGLDNVVVSVCSSTPPNHAPVANPQTVSTKKNVPAAITLAGTDLDGDALTYSVLTGPSQGTLSGAPPNLLYTPTADYNGPDSFTFTVNDGAINSAPAAVSITVLPGNIAPVAVNDAYTTDEDTVLTVGSPGLLGNDTDVDEGPLPRFEFAGWVWPPSNDPDFTYGQRFTGFYDVDPAGPAHDPLDSTLNLEFVCENAAWEMVFPEAGYLFRGGSTIVDVGNNTTFGDRYVVTLYNGGSVGTALPSGRQLGLAQMDLFDGVAGGADLLTDDSIQTTTIPLALAQNTAGRFLFQDNSQPSLIFDHLVGPKSVTQVNGDVAGVGTETVLPSGAQLRVNANGSFSYDPRGHFDQLRSGETAAETFIYETSDREGATASATVTITIVGVNDAPAISNVIPDQGAVYGAAFSAIVPANTFSDADTGQPLIFGASGMPPGISFDSSTRTFSGDPTMIGPFTVTVTASDDGVPPLSASTSFNLGVAKAPLTVTADSFTRFYGEPNPPLTGTLVGVVNGDNITADYTTTATPTGAAGVYTIYPVLNDPDNKLGNYTATTINGYLRVNVQNQVITFDPIALHTYGDAPVAIPVTASSGLPVKLSSSVPTVATVNEDTITIVGAGTTTITATQTGDGNYYPATAVARTFTVAKAPLTISARQEKTYGAALPVLAASYTGFVNGDTTVNLTQLPTLSTTAKKASVVGDYLIALTGGAAANYQITLVNGTLTVTPAPLTITAVDKSNVYGTALPTLTATYAGFVNGDGKVDLDAPVVMNTTATSASNVGQYPILASGAADANYTITFMPGTLTITPHALTIRAQNKNKTYGAALPVLTAAYNGFVNGDSESVLDTPVALGTAGTASIPVGSYEITATGASDANYTIAFVAGTLTVNPATLTIKAVNESKVYGAALPPLTYNFTGFVLGDTEASLTTPVLITAAATAGSIVGNYPISVSGASNPNYTVRFVDGTLKITKAPLTITADDKTRRAGQPNPALTASYSGFVNGDSQASLDTPVTLSTTAKTTSPAGTYPIKASAAKDANYTITFVNGILTVTP